MSSEVKVVMLTGDKLRHRYAAAHLAERTNLLGVISEEKSNFVKNPETLVPEDRQIIDWHFADRDKCEARYFGKFASFPDTDLLRLPAGGANGPGVCEWVQSRAPDVVLLYGSSIIRPPLLSLYEGRMINLHLGLAPYYRGGGTNFWPLVNRQPECVGATIHLAVLKVDAGAMLAQVRPEAEKSDGAHDLGTKTIIAAVDLIPSVLAQRCLGRLGGRLQDLDIGAVYRRRDFHAAAVRKMWRNFESGMMDEFVDDRQGRCEPFPIVEWN